ncbi:FliH/SctL family protein [Marinospirillum sp. MEB164]|uniref:Flagellar assembly protein FliH n=1 Tax=Marinospirillum alkalitolerans TaxID=3123374 RepID=A0ABW8PVC3_9GAMM
MTSRKRIPAEEQVPFRRWEMPDLTGIKRSIARRLDELEAQTAAAEQEEAPAEPQLPTAEEVEALRAEAEQAGYQAGQEAGHAAGYEAGRALGYQEGEAQGQEAGFQVGYQRGLDEAQHEIDAQLARLASLIHQLQGPIQELDFEVEQALLGLVDQLCRALIRREVALDRDYLRDIIKESIAALPPGYQRLNIHFHPDDLPLVEAACASLLDRYQLTPNVNITPGGVELETRQSLVDATLEQRYKKLVGQLVAGQYQQRLGEMDSLADEQLDTPEPVSAVQSTAPTSESSSVEPLSVEPAAMTPVADGTSLDPMPEAVSMPDAVTEAEPDLEQAARPAHSVSEATASSAAAQAEQPAENAAAPVSRVSLQRQAAPRQPIPATPEPLVNTTPAAEVGEEETSLDSAQLVSPMAELEPEQAATSAALSAEAELEAAADASLAESALAQQAPGTEQSSLAQHGPLAENAASIKSASADEPEPETEQAMHAQPATELTETEEVAVPSAPVTDLDDLSEDEFFAQALEALDSEMELVDEDIDAELDTLLSSVGQEEPAAAEEGDDQPQFETETPESAEATWAPESVHEGRYLQEDSQDAWADDFLSDLDEPLEEMTPKSQGPVSG